MQTYKLDSREADNIRDLLKRLKVSAERITIDLKQNTLEVQTEKQKIKTPDAIIAATAKCHNLCLVTRDRDFKVFEDYFAVLIQ